MAASQKTAGIFHLFKQWIIIALGVAVAAWLSEGIRFDSASSLILAVVLIAALNVFLKPLLVFFGLPFIVMTFGIGLLLINAVIFMLVGSIVPGFHIAGFWPAFWGAIVVSMTTLLVNAFLAKPKIVVTTVSSGRAPKAKGGAKEYRGRMDDIIDL